ncbi:probable magnesium transporter NIPA9 isoform X2 [Aristolochia californica]
MASVISKIRFNFMEQGFSKLVPFCLSVSISCSGTGFVYQTRGFKYGRAIVVSTCAAVASIVTGVLAGIFALGERLPSAPVARLIVLLGWLLWGNSAGLFSKTIISSSTAMAPPLQQGHGEEPQFVVGMQIQASSLHHLITSPKEKH